MRSIILLFVLLAPNLTQAEGFQQRKGHGHHGDQNRGPYYGRSHMDLSRTSFVAEGPYRIKVIVDGKILNPRPLTRINGVALSPGSHSIRVIAYGPRQTKELRSRFNVPRRGNQRFFVRSAGRGGGIYLDRSGNSISPVYRRGRLHETVNYRVTDPCYDARYFNVELVVEQMNCQPFDRSKLEIAKSAVHYNQLFAADVKYLMDQMVFDQAKVDLAAFAYSNVCNANEFYVVFSSLTFQSSIGRLKQITGYY